MNRMKLIIFLLILYTENIKVHPSQKKKDYLSTQIILNVTVDIIKDTNRRIDDLSLIKEKSSGNVAFEIGYLIYTIQEKYRRMVDKYNTSHYMRRRLYLMELVLYLEEIERHYWEIDHLSKMLHETERKYGVAKVEQNYYIEDDMYFVTNLESTSHVYYSIAFPTRTKSKKRKLFKQEKYFINKFLGTKKTTTKWWPIDYGWEIDYYW